MTAPGDPAIVIGAGPAGLAAARALGDRGVAPVLVIDRDDEPGGLPRFCGHPGFGWEYTRRLERGPAMVRRMIAAIDTTACRIRTRTTALAIRPGPIIEVIGPETGRVEIRARAVVVATGIRERSRHARLVPGDRPERGILTTGQLQQMVSRGVSLSGSRAVIVGSEHVSFSALVTARQAGLRVVEMIEPGARIFSFSLVGAIARHVVSVPVSLNSRVDSVLGNSCVEGVVVVGPSGSRTVPCDAVIFSSDFVPDAPLVREAGITIDPATGGPEIDQLMRTSMPGVFAAGNLLRPVETSGIAAREGARAGACAAAYLAGGFGWRSEDARIAPGRDVALIVPQRWARDAHGVAADPTLRPSLRVSSDIANARVQLRAGDKTIWQSRRKHLLRGRRMPLELLALTDVDAGPITVEISPSR